MEHPLELDPDTLRRSSDPRWFDFETTDELPDLERLPGQPRLEEALELGIGLRRPGFNLYVQGEPGMGKHTMVRRHLERIAALSPPPDDWVHVHNFDDENRPRALRLPAGRGFALREEMDRLIEDVRAALPAAFDSEEYRRRVHEIELEFQQRPEKAFEAIREEAETLGIALLRTPDGFAFAPLKEGEVMPPDEYAKLPEEERSRIEGEIERLQEKMQKVVHQMPAWHREMHGRMRELDREVAGYAVNHLVEEVRARYGDLPEVARHIARVGRDMVEHANRFLQQQDGISDAEALEMFRHRYGVNLMVDHRDSEGVPVVYEDNPVHANLVGRVEYLARQGALVTDFTLIRPGALHRANGGYLLLDVYKILATPFAWESLKRALFARSIRIESAGQALGLISTVSLEPEPIPLDVKVVLFGDRFAWYLLQEYDPDFGALFKVLADISGVVERSEENVRDYARLLASRARREGLRSFRSEAMAALLDHAARMAEDAERISTRTRVLFDVMVEADHRAAAKGLDRVGAEEVRAALAARIFRVDRIREHVLEEIRRGTILVDVAGERIGQVNGLSVIDLGDFAFGRPSRISATVRMGEGEVVDIEREVELGGPIHSKAVLILSRFLAARYVPDRPLSLSASLVFEQSYGPVEGDSASVAELTALLSALAQAPVRQSLAVTGSINQYGEVQAIGGVNEKIEGFFDVCRTRGLEGQGVIIPHANVRHLMLREDVVDAVREGWFHVYAVHTVDEAVELLTGLPAGERGEEGRFPEGTLNQRVEGRLIQLAELRQAWSGKGRDHDE